MSICCHFIQNCLHYLKKCSVRVCCGLLPPVLNAVAEIVAEAGSAVWGLGVGTWAAEFASAHSYLASWGCEQPEQGWMRGEAASGGYGRLSGL